MARVKLKVWKRGQDWGVETGVNLGHWVWIVALYHLIRLGADVQLLQYLMKLVLPLVVK